MNKSYYRIFFEVQKKHWWFVAKKKIVLDQINRFVSVRDSHKILDIGCGSGKKADVGSYLACGRNDVVTRHGGGARSGLKQRSQQPQAGRLPRAVDAQQTKNLSWLTPEADAIHCADEAIY